MSTWVAAEMAAWQTTGAALSTTGREAVRSLPSACHGWAETDAAYRVLDNLAIGMQAILSGHKQATLTRLQTQDVGLLVQDTTFLDYGTTQPKAGMGTVKVKKRLAYDIKRVMHILGVPPLVASIV